MKRASSLCMAACLLLGGCLVSDPESSDVAIEKTVNGTLFLSGLCPGESLHGLRVEVGGRAIPVRLPGKHADDDVVSVSLEGLPGGLSSDQRIEFTITYSDDRGRSRTTETWWVVREIDALKVGDVLDDGETLISRSDLKGRNCG